MKNIISSINDSKDLITLMGRIEDVYDESKKFVIQEIITNSLKYSGRAKVILNGVTIEVIQDDGDIENLRCIAEEIETCVATNKVHSNFGLNMIRMLGWQIQELYRKKDGVHIVFHKTASAIN